MKKFINTFAPLSLVIVVGVIITALLCSSCSVATCPTYGSNKGTATFNPAKPARVSHAIIN